MNAYRPEYIGLADALELIERRLPNAGKLLEPPLIRFQLRAALRDGAVHARGNRTITLPGWRPKRRGDIPSGKSALADIPPELWQLDEDEFIPQISWEDETLRGTEDINTVFYYAISVRREDIDRIWPPAPNPETVQNVPGAATDRSRSQPTPSPEQAPSPTPIAVKRQPSRKGPVRGTVARYAESDKALIPEIDRRCETGCSATEAIEQLVDEGKVDGRGFVPASKVARVRTAYFKEKKLKEGKVEEGNPA